MMKTLLRTIYSAVFCTALIPGLVLAEDKPDSDWYKKSPLGAGILSDLIREGDISPGDDLQWKSGDVTTGSMPRSWRLTVFPAIPESSFPKTFNIYAARSFP